jgi:hypothetical protein
MASSLTEPEMFGDNSASALEDLFQLLTIDLGLNQGILVLLAHASAIVQW